MAFAVCVGDISTHGGTIVGPGSATVMFGGVPALRTTDACICGAMAAVGQPTIMIG